MIIAVIITGLSYLTQASEKPKVERIEQVEVLKIDRKLFNAHVTLSSRNLLVVILNLGEKLVKGDEVLLRHMSDNTITACLTPYHCSSATLE